MVHSLALFSNGFWEFLETSSPNEANDEQGAFLDRLLDTSTSETT
jgi:hypothetical protein